MSKKRVRDMSAEEVIDQLPVVENTDWEWKNLDPDRGGFDENIGKQASAFANSQGGYIALGITNDKQFAPLPLMRSPKERMSDWLNKKVHQSVEPWLNDFEIYPLESTDKPGHFVYVIAVGDSAAAPHWARSLKNFYYRLSGESHPAPPLHLNLLRDRTTKSRTNNYVTVGGSSWSMPKQMATAARLAQASMTTPDLS